MEFFGILHVIRSLGAKASFFKGDYNLNLMISICGFLASFDKKNAIFWINFCNNFEDMNLRNFSKFFFKICQFHFF